MKRDVKVGLFVAAVVCSVAALLLGGGMVGRTGRPAPPLRMSPQEDAPGALPADLTAAVLPPVEAEEFSGDFTHVPLEAEAVANAELVDIPFDVFPAEPLSHTLEFDAAFAEGPLSLLEAGPSASARAAAVRLEIVELTEAQLLARELAAVGGAREGPAAAGSPALMIAPPASVIAVPAPAVHIYVLRPGDSFWTVSKKVYGTARHFDDIREANPDLDPKKLRPGMQIAIPEIPGVTMRRDLLADAEDLREKRRPRVYLAQDKVHVVQPREILEDIALKYYGFKHKWPHIVRANPDLDPRKIRPGDKIVVPALTE